MSEIHGLVTGVREQILGDAVSVAASAGDSVLHVYDTADFDEDGGWLFIPGVLLAGVPMLPRAYTTIDDDASTITLDSVLPGTVSLPVDTEVQVYDWANSQAAVVYKAVVDSLDGFDGDPVEAVVDQGLAHALSQSMRDGTGESVTLERDGSELRLTAIHGRRFSLAALQYLQGGMTTRTAEDQAGVDILGADTGTPGILAFADGGDPTVVIDAETGNASFIGEIGTAPPGDLGVFVFSPTFGNIGSQVTIPTVMLNTGASRVQPRVMADSDGSGSGLFFFSGAGTSQRESQIVCDNGAVWVGIETTVGSNNFADGARFYLDRDALIYHTDFQYGTNDVAGVVYADGLSAFVGYRDDVGTNFRGFAVARTGGCTIAGSSAAQVVTIDAAAFQDINVASVNYTGALNHVSDRKLKADITDAPDALALIRRAPAYQWRYSSDPKSTRRFGPMADDFPAYMGSRLPKDHLTHPGARTLDTNRLVGLHHRALEQLDEQNAAQAQQIAELTTRVDQLQAALAARQE